MDKNTIATIITEWVFNNFGESEAKDPSWNIDDLAEYIYKHKTVTKLIY